VSANRALSSVGAYQFEGEGIQLFERIDGDYFTIIGLPHASAACQSCANWTPSMAESLGSSPRIRAFVIGRSDPPFALATDP
jgi:hypothetical protein